MVSYWLDLFLQKIFKDFSSCCLLKVKPWTTRPGFEYFLIINLIFPLFFFFFHFKYTVKWRDVNKRVSDKNLLLSKLLGPCSLTLKYLYDFCVVVADLEGVTINLPLWQNSINKDSYFVRFFWVCTPLLLWELVGKVAILCRNPLCKFSGSASVTTIMVKWNNWNTGT